MSFIKIKIVKMPKIEPSGTPHVAPAGFKRLLFKEIH